MRLPMFLFVLFLLGSGGCMRASETLQHDGTRVNVAPHGIATASLESHSAGNAIDDKIDSIWNSQRHAPVWLSIALDSYYMVDKIELVVSQHQPGPTTHEIWLRDESHTLSLLKRLENVQTEDGQVLEVRVDPPRRIDEVYVLTSQSQGWVAWWEIRVLGTLDPDTWILKKVATGLHIPVQVAHAGDSSGRLFVVEKPGHIRTIRNGVVEESPFLNISDRVSSGTLEQGLFDIAFPPSFPDRHKFYVSYTDANGNTVISRFAMSADLEIADPDSEEILLTIEQPHEDHNGGQLVFGPRDGYLYIGSGDGGGTENFTDLIDESTRNKTLLSKILRIDVESEAKPYGIPADNPFVDDTNYRPEIWALGLRNPWGLAFDPDSGDLYITDSGWGREEEINFQSADSAGGEHYGWPVWEGNLCFEELGLSCFVEDYVSPVASYNHGNGCAVVGGVVNQGTFYYADFCRGRVWSLQRLGEGWKSELLIGGAIPMSSIGIDEAATLYATGVNDGSIYALVRQSTSSEQ